MAWTALHTTLSMTTRRLCALSLVAAAGWDEGGVFVLSVYSVVGLVTLSFTSLPSHRTTYCFSHHIVPAHTSKLLL